jgi:trimeric autotransporter adhesin
MKRFLIFGFLLVFSLPVGFSIAGCAGTNPNNYCNKSGFGYGLKTNQVAAISLQPQTTGISMGFGQTGQLQSPTATNCNGGSETVAAYTYGSSNLNLIDVSSTGALCGGTWNRHSPGGIADFTICTAPTPAAIAAGCTGTGTAPTCLVNMTASGDGVTSNTLPVWVHPSVTTIQLSLASPTGAPNYTGCFSQNQTSQLDAIAFVSGISTPFCAPAGTTGIPAGVPDCSVNLGHFTYTPVNATIVTIDQNGVATAHQPGSTAITAAISNVSSTAGFFPTCPPATIQVQIPSTISSNPFVGSVTPGTAVPLTTTITDTQGSQITGLSLSYSSTNPLEISVGSSGSVSTAFPSTAAITATCTPPSCNPSVITQIGQLGTGLPVVSNSVRLTSTGRSSTYLWMASPQSDFFEPVDLNTGTIGSPIKLPYIPNSMVLDPGGNNLYFGNYRELMAFSSSTNAVSKEDTTVPGVVLAVSPDSSTVVIADQIRQVIYLYTVSTAVHTSIGGLGTRAAFSPDGTTLYVTGPNSLYIHNSFSGWSVYDNLPTQTGAGCTLDNSGTSPFCSPDLAVTIPSEGIFLSGPTDTTAYSFCPVTTTTPFVYYPGAATVPAATDHITATTDRVHILGANVNSLTDIYLGTASSPGVPIESNPADAALNGTCIRPATPGNTVAGLTFQATAVAPQTLPVTASSIDQVVASPDSTIAFVTYTAPAGTASPVLPAYTISSTFGEAGTLSPVTLSGTATAPLAGIFSPDNSMFFVGTAGDNLVHFVDVPTLTDTKTINPGLVDPTGTAVPVQFFAVKPRPTT